MPPKRKSKRHSKRMKSGISDRSFEAKNRAFHVIARMRHDGVSLRDAAREENTTGATVRKHLPRAFRRSKSGEWVVTKSDRYVRLLSLPGPHGPVTVSARGSKEAQFASVYLASLSRWQRTEKAYELAPFHGKKIGGFTLLTASRTLRALRDTGLLQFDSLYASVKETV
jgi:lambda repressor-like predicted transcriptional regulator